MKRATAGLAAVTTSILLIGDLGCGSQTPKGDPEVLIRAAMASKLSETLGLAQLFPKKPGTVSCVIPGGGPPPGAREPGTCTTFVQLPELVRFTEAWDSFSYSWEFTVSATGEVLKTRSYGDPPPQLWV